MKAINIARSVEFSDTGQEIIASLRLQPEVYGAINIAPFNFALSKLISIMLTDSMQWNLPVGRIKEE
ncbi:MAG: hypothetical protein M0023_07560 [Desulfobacteraceae bacterium]|nr:hypothetical protein [Desulfobacteraceae bacterium]